MNITIIGAGNVGAALAAAWARTGHDIVLGTRDPSSDKITALVGSLSQAGSGAVSARTLSDCATDADLVVLATPWHATEATLAIVGDLAGKIIMDCTNPLRIGDDGIELAMGYDTSGGEAVQAWVPAARVVKTFNQTGFDNMIDAHYPGGTPVMFYCGDDVAAKSVCRDLIGEVGFEPVDAGALKIARLLEPHGMLWINMALKQGLGRDVAYALLRRPSA